MAQTQIQTQKASPGTLSALLTQYRDQIAMALPKHLTVERMIRVALTAVTRTPALQQCDSRSVAAAVIQAAALGLEPDGVLGQAYMLPYGNQCQLIPGYRGLIQLSRNSGQLIFIDAQVVKAGDKFDYEFGLHPVLMHKRGPNYSKEPMEAVWAGARLKDGGEQIVVMDRGEVEQIRDKHSKAAKNGPWVTHFDEMAKKTALRRLCKLLPMSVQMQTAVSLGESEEAGLPQQFTVDVPLELQAPADEVLEEQPIEEPKRKSQAAQAAVANSSNGGMPEQTTLV
jgi:recombination protein RecT